MTGITPKKPSTWKDPENTSSPSFSLQSVKCDTLENLKEKVSPEDFSFVKRKQFVEQHHLESLSLLCLINQLREEQRLRKSKTKTTNPSKIGAINQG